MGDNPVRSAKPLTRRRIVVVEYDVTRLTHEQVDALLLGALATGHDVSFKIDAGPGVPACRDLALRGRS